MELPPDVHHYKTAGPFAVDEVPAGLLRAHNTRAGVWGRIVVIQGVLRYEGMDGSDVVEQVELTPQRSGVSPPQVIHRVTPLTLDTVFTVEFYKAQD